MILIALPSISPGSELEPGDEIRLVRSETLLFRGEPLRSAKEGDCFTVLKTVPENDAVYLLVIDDKGRDIAVTVPRDAVVKVGTKVEALRDQALAAMKRSKFDEVARILSQMAKIAPADGRLQALKEKLAAIKRAKANVASAKAAQAKARAAASAKRRGANVADRPNAFSSSDNSNRSRAEAMRREADELEAAAALKVLQAENEYSSLTGTEILPGPAAGSPNLANSPVFTPGKELSETERSLQTMQRAREEAIFQSRQGSDFAKWLASPINKERFVEPQTLAAGGTPSYAETLEFINGKLGPLMTLGFGERTQKMILRFNFENGPGFTAVFDPRELNAEVRYQQITRRVGEGIASELRIEGRVILEARSGDPEFLIYQPHSSEAPVKQHSLTIGETGLIDGLTAERLAEAFSHLIVLFGGKKEAF